MNHLWQWLTTGQNAAALQAVCALFALIGLFLYTLYTRKMMKLGELTRRASIAPVFTLSDTHPFYLNQSSDEMIQVNMTVRNIGEGPAAIIWAWHQPTTATFALKNTPDVLLQSTSARLAEVPAGELLKGEATEITFRAFDPNNDSNKHDLSQEFTFPLNQKWLFVVDATDLAGGRHQLQMLKTAGAHGPIDVKMTHSLGDSFGERTVKTVRRFVEIIQASGREIRKLWSEE